MTFSGPAKSEGLRSDLNLFRPETMDNADSTTSKGPFVAWTLEQAVQQID